MHVKLATSGSVISSRTLRQIDGIFLVIAFAFLYFHLFLWPATPIYYEMDHVALLNDAKRMLHGEAIYRDFFEFVFPGVHLLYAALMEVFGPRYWIANFYILVHGLVSTALCVALGRKIIGSNLYSFIPAGIYLFLGFRWFGIDGEHRMFSPIFACLAVLVLLERRSTWRLAAAGFFCALSSYFTQQRGIMAVAAIGIFLLYEFGAREGQWKKAFQNCCILSGVYLSALVLMILPFVIIAGPQIFFDSTFLFLVNYVQDPDTNGVQGYLGTIAKLRTLGYLITGLAIFYYLLIPLIYVVTLLVLRWKRRVLESREHLNVLLVCLLGGFLSLGTFAPNAGRLFQIAVPAVVLFGWLVYRILPGRQTAVGGALVALVMFGIIQAARLQTGWEIYRLQTPSGELGFLSPIFLERYAWLSEHANRGEYVYETYNSHVNFPLDLPNPSRISVALNSGYTPHSQVMQIISDLKSKNPRYIIWDAAWSKEMPALRDEEKLKPVYNFMVDNYELRQQFTPYDGREREVWELKNSTFSTD